MLRFKQFLIENVDRNVRIVIKVETKSPRTIKLLSRIRERLKEKLGEGISVIVLASLTDRMIDITILPNGQPIIVENVYKILGNLSSETKKLTFPPRSLKVEALGPITGELDASNYSLTVTIKNREMIDSIVKYVTATTMIIRPNWETSDKIIPIGLLWLFKVKGLRVAVNNWTVLDKKLSEVLEIINKHLQGERDILDCQEELIKSGLKDYARL